MKRELTPEREREKQEIIYFFDNNFILMKGGAAIVLVCCAFWTLFNFMTEDSMYLFRSGAIWTLFIMIAASVVIILIGKHLDGIEEKGEREIHLWSWCCMFYFGFLFIMVSMVTAAGVMSSTVTGAEKSILEINLVSTLLFLPVITAMPQKLCGYILGVELVGFAFVPYAIPGCENYSIIQELVLRACLIAAYIIVRRRTHKAFEVEQKLKAMNEEVSRTNEEVIDLLMNAVEARDTESGEHVKRVRYFTYLLAEDIRIEYAEYDLSPERVNIITRASGMHDIGKIMIPDSILQKPGKLTAEEWQIMKTHSERGYELLKEAPKAWGTELIRISKEICLYHHEKYDGSGYPVGLIGEEIPVWAQIVSLADCYEALTSDRVYKKACSPEIAYNMIMNGECGVFSDKMLKSFTRVKDQFADMVISK